MKKFRKNLKITAAVSLAAVMAVQTPVLAAPMDDLSEIMKKQAELEQESLLEENLGMGELGEGIEDKGLAAALTLGLTPETAEQLGLPGVTREDTYLKMNTQVDLNAKEWLFELGAAMADYSLLDISAYGDQEQFSLSIPQFFTGALAVRSGSFMEQYNGSGLEQFLGELPEGSGDVDMQFFPEGSAESPFEGQLEQINDSVKEKAQAVADNMQVEVEEKDGQTVYTVVCPTKGVLDIYKEAVQQYFSLFSAMGIVMGEELTQFEGSLEESIDSAEQAMPEDVSVCYYVQDDLVNRIYFETTFDTTDMVVEEMETPDTTEDGAAEQDSQEIMENGDTEAPSEDSQAVTGGILNLAYDILYKDPSNPGAGFELNFTGKEEDGEDEISMLIDMAETRTDTTSEMTIDLTLKEMEEVIYDGRIMRYAFDADTGDININMSVEDGAEAVELVLDGTFTDVEKGKSFTLNLDELSFSAGGESMGLNGEIAVSAEPGEMKAPEDSRVLLELSQEELKDLLMEINQKAAAWMQQFSPAPESYDEDIDGEYSYDMDEDESGGDIQDTFQEPEAPPSAAA